MTLVTKPHTMALMLAAQISIAFAVQAGPLPCDGQSPIACFDHLGDLPGAQVNSNCDGISADGMVVVGTSSSRAVRWTSALGLVPVNPTPTKNDSGIATDVSGDGTVIVGVDFAEEPDRAFGWFNGTYMLIPALPGGNGNNSAFCVSADGLVIAGTSRAAVGEEGYRWTAATGTQSIGDLPGGNVHNNPYAITPNGSMIVGSSMTAAGTEAYRWTAATGIQSLGDLPGGVVGSIAKDLSHDGSVIVGNSVGTGVSEFFRWTELDGMVGLGSFPGSIGTSANACNQDASIIVGQATMPGFTGRPVIWTMSLGVADFQQLLIDEYGLGDSIAGWNLNIVRDVSADGLTYSGTGINPLSIGEAWIVHLPYPPGQPKPLCPADIAPVGAPDGVVNVQDLLAVIGAWGPCGDPNNCAADIAPIGPPMGDDIVNVQDLLAVIGAWGACP